MTPWQLLRRRAAGGDGRPVLTWYGPDQRAELSAVSLDNAVAKAAGLLRDDLDVQPGDALGVDLPLHWQLPVWLLAASAVGAVAVVLPRGGDGAAGPAADAPAPDVVVTWDAGPAEAWLRAGAQVVVVPADALGLPGAPAPAGAVDAAVEVRAHADVFAPWAVPGDDDPWLVPPGAAGPLGGAGALLAGREELARLGVPPGGRLLLAGGPVAGPAHPGPAHPGPGPAGLLAALAAVAGGGSVVLVEGAGPDRLRELAAAERVDAAAGPAA